MSKDSSYVDVIASSSGLRTRMELRDGIKFFFRLGVSIGRKLEGDFILGHDTRKSSAPFADALASGLASTGMQVTVCGICPVFVVSYLVSKRLADFGLMVTASHNPPEWNGLKLFGPSGVIVDGGTISSVSSDAFKSDAAPEVRKFERAEDMQEEYVRDLLSELHQLRLSVKGIKVAVDAGNGASAALSHATLEEAGANVVAINQDMSGTFHRTIEPKVESLSGLGEAVRSNKCDFGVGYDCDGDRAVMADETGRVLKEDMTLLASLRCLLDRIDTSFVVNCASSSAFSDLAHAMGRDLFLSNVGERNVVLKMREKGALLGGEGSSGGVIYAKLAATRDGMLATMAIAALVREAGPIGPIVKPYLKYHEHRVNVPFPSSADEREVLSSLKNAFSEVRCEEWDGLKFFEADGWALIRASKTEPVIRIIAEALSDDRAMSLADKYSSALAKLLR